MMKLGSSSMKQKQNTKITNGQAQGLQDQNSAYVKTKGQNYAYLLSKHQGNHPLYIFSPKQIIMHSILRSLEVLQQDIHQRESNL